MSAPAIDNIPAALCKPPEKTVAVSDAELAFLNEFVKEGDGLLELRATPIVKNSAPVHRDFFKPGDLAGVKRFFWKERDRNIYFAIAARRDRSSGALKNCSVIRALFADLDFKTTSEDQARQALENFPLPVSLLVNSGGGFHAYLLLDPPADLQKDAAKVGSLLRRLAVALGADMNSAEPAHVLRPIRTFNLKKDYESPREVRLA